MTTPEAERQYLNEHLQKWGGRPFAVHNPHGKPVEELPIIYGFNNGGNPGWYSGQIIAEDGTVLGGHACSHESYMYHDLGIVEGSSPSRHETFRAHYPNGYRMVFVPSGQVRTHAGLTLAYQRNQEKGREAAAREAVEDVEADQ